MRMLMVLISILSLASTSVEADAQSVKGTKGLPSWKPPQNNTVLKKDSSSGVDPVMRAQVTNEELLAAKKNDVVKDSVYDNMVSRAMAENAAPKDALAVFDRLYAYTRRQIKSGADIADCIVKNDHSCLRVTPQEYLRTFNATHPTLEFKSVADLANWLRQLVVVSCPKVKVRLAALALPSRKLELRLWARMLRNGELCLVDTNDNRVAMSMSCGNPLPDVLPYEFPKPKDEPKPPEPKVAPPVDTTTKAQPPVAPVDTTTKAPPVRSVAIKANPLTAKLYVGDTLRATAEVFVLPDSLSKDVSWQSIDPTIATVTSSGLIQAVKPGTVQIVVTAVADMTKSATVNITVVKKKNHNVLYIGAGVVTAGVACAIWCPWTTTKTTIVYDPGGQPANPPNNMTPWWTLLLRGNRIP